MSRHPLDRGVPLYNRQDALYVCQLPLDLYRYLFDAETSKYTIWEIFDIEGKFTIIYLKRKALGPADRHANLQSGSMGCILQPKIYSIYKKIYENHDFWWSKGGGKGIIPVGKLQDRNNF